MRNQYPGTCYRCGERVEACDGHFERITPQKRREFKFIGTWLTQHATCAIAYRGTDAGLDGKRVARPKTVAEAEKIFDARAA